MSVEKNDEEARPNVFRETFIGLLAYDIILALRRMEANDDQSARRDFVRTVFAAIEGWILDCRQGVQESLASIRDLSPAEKAAFAEATYSLTETGMLREQTRFFPMTTMFRFVTRLVEQECGKPIVDFSSFGWEKFKQATDIRNRVTHPKCIHDLNITSDEIATVRAAYEWLLLAILDVRTHLKAELAVYLKNLGEVVGALKAGDPAMLELYNNVLDEGGT
jgi:hypothetical protein